MTLVQTSRKEAEAITADLKARFQKLHVSWHDLGRRVAQAIEKRVPFALNLTVPAWLEQTFDESASHLYRLAHSYRALADAGIPDKKQEKMPEKNANELATKLSKKDRAKPEFVKAAIEQPSSEFHKTVTEFRAKKYGIPPSKYKTFAILVSPESCDDLHAVFTRLGAILGEPVNAEGSQGVAAKIRVVEALVAFFATSTDEQIKVWFEGDPNGVHLPELPEAPNGSMAAGDVSGVRTAAK